MRYALINIVILHCHLLSAQSIPLNGVVVVQNSEYETGQRIYITDASIRAPLAKPVTTDKQGSFALEFAGVPSGSPVRLTVNKPGLEVVNSNDVGQVILGRATPVQIVMADPDKLAATQLKYYNIATNSITKTYERRMAALRSENAELEVRLAALQAETGEPVTTLEEGIDLLTTQREDGIKNAMDLAQKFAEVNLDEASALYRKAYEAFLRAQLDSVLMILSTEKLDEELARLTEQKTQAENLQATVDKGLRQLFDSYMLKADVLYASVNYREERAVIEKAKALLEAHHEVFDPAMRAGILRLSGLLYWTLGRSEEALKEHLAAWELASRELPPGHIMLSLIQHELSNVYGQMGRWDEALDAEKRSISISQEANGNDEGLVENYDGLGVCLRQLGDIEGAIRAYRKALEIAEQDTVKYAVVLGNVHGNLASTLQDAGKPNEALDEIREGHAINLRVLPPDHPQLAQSYRHLSVILMMRREWATSLEAAEEALAIQLRTLGHDHPDLIDTYGALGINYDRVEDHEAAVNAFRKAFSISRKLGSPNPNQEALLLMNAGMPFVRSNRSDTALVLVNEALALKERVAPPGDPSIPGFYRLKGEVYAYLGRNDTAMACFERGLGIAIRDSGPEDIRTADLRQCLGRLAAEECDLATAVSNYRQCMSIWGNAYGKDSHNVAVIFLDMAVAFNYADLPDSSIVWALRHQDFLRAHGDASGLRMANSRCTLAWALAKKGDLDSALAIAREQVRSYERVFPNEFGGRGTAHTVVGWTLEKEGEFPQALDAFRSSLDEYRKALGPGHWKIARTQYYIGRVLYEQGDGPAAQAELDSSSAIRPTCDAAWFRYRIAADEGDDELALDRLADFLRIPVWLFGKLPVDREEQRRAMRSLATKLHRDDILEEFHLN